MSFEQEYPMDTTDTDSEYTEGGAARKSNVLLSLILIHVIIHYTCIHSSAITMFKI